MDDSLLMRVLDGMADSREEGEPLLRVKSVFVAVMRNGNTLYQFHGEKRTSGFRCASIEHLGNVRMVHERKGLPFGLKTGDDLISAHTQFDDHQRDATPYRCQLLRHINDAAATLTYFLKEFV